MFWCSSFNNPNRSRSEHSTANSGKLEKVTPVQLVNHLLNSFDTTAKSHFFNKSIKQDNADWK